jgi:hypothetical protein
MTDLGGAFILQTARPSLLLVPAAVDRAAVQAAQARDAGIRSAYRTAPAGFLTSCQDLGREPLTAGVVKRDNRDETRVVRGPVRLSAVMAMAVDMAVPVGDKH